MKYTRNVILYRVQPKFMFMFSFFTIDVPSKQKPIIYESEYEPPELITRNEFIITQ